MPRLDVVIPAYRPDAQMLARAVESARVCVQAIGGGGRVIVVDDGSPEPVALCKEGVEVVRQSNGGPSAARNTGLRLVTGEYVLLLDADDEAIVGGVERVFALMREHGGVIGLGARVKCEVGGRKRRMDVPAEWADRVLPRRGDVFRPIGLFSSTGVVVSARVMDHGVWFDEGLRIGEDRDYFRRAADVGPVVIGAEPTVNYTVHGAGAGNLTARTHLDRWVEDHLVLVGRHMDDESREHFKDATKWLANQVSKAGGLDKEWGVLTELMRREGWNVSWKSRWHRGWGRVWRGVGERA